MINLNQQIEEVVRELGKRRDVYPRQVNAGKMRESEAKYHVERMEAVLATLRWLQSNEQIIKQRIGHDA